MALSIAAALTGLWAGLILVQTDPTAAGVQRGGVLAKTRCGACHAVGRTGASPLRGAPPFRELHRHYDVEDLAESLAEGIRSGHPEMPEARFATPEIHDLIAYLKSLESAPAPRARPPLRRRSS